MSHAVEEGDGFANFREPATKTNSLIDPLEYLRLPNLAGGKNCIGRFHKIRTRPKKLSPKVEQLVGAINKIVYYLYGLTDVEIEIMEQSEWD